jgi:hypothetical protein
MPATETGNADPHCRIDVTVAITGTEHRRAGSLLPTERPSATVADTTEVRPIASQAEKAGDRCGP